MHYASRKAIDPTAVSDAVVDAMMDELRTTSLRRNQNRLRRKVTIAWNKLAARRPDLGLQTVTIPPSRQRLTRRRWADCPASLVDEVEAYLAWCGGADPFDPAARRRALAPGTIAVRRVRLNHAITLLVENGTDIKTIRSLADLVSPEALRTILRARHAAAEGRATYYNQDLAATLLQMAKEWVKVDAETMATLRLIASKLPTLQPGMTERNAELLRQFDDPNAFKRLRRAVEGLWKEVEATEKPTQWTLAKAQATLAIAILTYIPIRLHNLAALEFDRHLHLPVAEGAVATLTLPAHEVKNRRDYAAPIPSHVAAMLTAYRRKIAPKILGHQPDHLFVNRDGRRKTTAAVRSQIQTYMDRHVGVDFNPHTFRHLSGKVILDAEPGSHETVRQLLGHSRLKTTTDYYTGIDTMRAAAHHQGLIDTALEAPAKPRRRKAPKRER
jgi:integrase